MRAREFKQARARLGLSQAGLAKALGRTRLQVIRYEAGQAKVPTVVALAVEALEHRQQAASSPKRPA
jgi:transcriptional regulator with XRE-family HTH domain